MADSTNRWTRLFLVAGFLAIVFGVGTTQAIVDLTHGERPQCLDLFVQAPSESNLRTYEKGLERRSWFAQNLRPWAQFARFVALGETGEKALLAETFWWFYRPGVQYLVEPPPDMDEAFAAIVGFRDKLAERGIRLLVVPAPGKASVEPDKLTPRADDESIQRIDTHTKRLIARLREARVEVVDLLDVYKRHKFNPREKEVYLVQDTHWSPRGMSLAARAVADKLLELGWVTWGNTGYRLKPFPLVRRGDVVEMMQSPPTERLFAPKVIECSQVVTTDTGEVYRDSVDSEILVMGDSFLRIYERDEPGSAGFVAHLAQRLGMPLTSIVNDGGASTLVRQELYRKPELLANKRVVVWEFVERDLRFGTEGWQDVPLPRE